MSTYYYRMNGQFCHLEILVYLRKHFLCIKNDKKICRWVCIVSHVYYSKYMDHIL